ncbi:macrophage colony-stimulating factor 1 isoform X1 [Dipodomys spectabilis]|uniref:macrophage colony-stimulating factor 1 isoform X1 n=1 Tax=Dipodomys spectabilis TaxID=105255 RepID=UPI001C53D89D|nr:macrophage colony-stimulating factor 1 isoform X1 [Dipodomys spectabilis]XP_042537346.1 macrophage colony-stimulating factor 1 isoform X1 [Dipodomys spectabilis]
MTARGAAGRCPPTTWLGPGLLLICLLVSRSIAKEVSVHCSHTIREGHLELLQQLIDSQMETSCQIAYEFVDQEQLEDPVCYIKKAFFLVQDIMEDTMRFKDNTPNAIAMRGLQELFVELQSCFTKDYKDHDKACVRTFHETPLQLLEKIKNVFNETKNLLENDWNIFSKNCNNSFAKCSSQDVVTKPDCNCLYPNATPSSDPASASPQQPLTPSIAPVADLTWADSEGTEGSSLLPSEQPLRTVDPGTAKQRPPRSTCQSLESPETPNLENIPIEDSPQPHPPAEGPTRGVEDLLDSELGTYWVLEEASGKADEDLVPKEAKLSPAGPVGGSILAEPARSSLLLTASSLLPTSTEDQQPADVPDIPLPKVDPMRPSGQAHNHTLEKTDGSSALTRDHQRSQEPSSPQMSSLRPQTPNNPATLSAQTQPPRSHSWGIVLPLGELEGKRSTRDRRSPAELEGGQASEGADRLQARFNSVPLTAAGHERQHSGSSDSQLPVFVFRLLVPSIILVLLAVGGLLFYRRRRRSHGEPQTLDFPLGHPEGSPLTQDEGRQVELPV